MVTASKTNRRRLRRLIYRKDRIIHQWKQIQLRRIQDNDRTHICLRASEDIIGTNHQLTMSRNPDYYVGEG